MRRVMSVFLPFWSTELVERQSSSEDDLLLYQEEQRKQFITGCCCRARDAGVRVGMSLAHARALIPEAQVLLHDLQWDERALCKLGRLALRFSPLVSIDKSPLAKVPFNLFFLYRGINLDITGTEQLFGSEERLAQLMLRWLAEHGFSARVAISPTLGASWALSRYGREPLCIAGGGLREELAQITTAALRIDPHVVDGLAEVGIHQIGELFDLSPGSLLERFGPQILRQLRYSKGQEHEVMEMLQEELPLQLTEIFSGPTTQSRAIELAVHSLLRRALEQLERRRRLVRSMTLEFGRTRISTVKKTISLNRPSASVEHLWSLIAPRLERIQLGYGIESISLTITESVFAEAKFATERTQHSQKDEGELLDTLTNKLGANRVFKVSFRESYIPERAFCFRSVSQGVGFASNTEPQVLVAGRPSFLLAEPESIRAIALLPDKPPHQIEWQRKTFRIKFGVGPERIAPEWWKESKEKSDSRDYFQVQLETGMWLWVYRELLSARWFVHGVWS